MFAMTLDRPTHQAQSPAENPPAFLRLGLIHKAWVVGGQEAALDMCRHLAEERPAAARVAVLEIEGLCLVDRWQRDTGLAMDAATAMIEALGGPTQEFFKGDSLDAGLQLVPKNP